MDEQDYHDRLARDVAEWQRRGIISPEQASQIIAQEGLGARRALGVLRLGWFVTAVSIAGAVILAAGVVLLFAANWNAMPDWFRTAMILAGIAASYAGGYALIYRYDMQRIGSALLLLGALLYEAGLFLITQIYNMPVDSPFLFLPAAIGIAPLAYLFGSRIIMLLAIGNATVWVIGELMTRYDESPESEAVLAIVAIWGILLYALGRLHGVRATLARFADAYVLVGVLLTLGLVYVFTFDEFWREIIDSVEPYSAPSLLYIAIAVGFALVVAQFWLRPSDTESTIDITAQAALLALSAVVVTWPVWTGYTIVFNAVFFAIAIALVTRGYLLGDERYINFGLAAVALGVLTRYVDVFWSLLANSAFFIIGGLLLLAVAYGLERLRRGLVQSMSEGGDGNEGGDTAGRGQQGLPA